MGRFVVARFRSNALLAVTGKTRQYITVALLSLRPAPESSTGIAVGRDLAGALAARAADAPR